MARVLHQEFYRDPVLGVIGMHRIACTSAGSDSFTVPPVTAPNAVTIRSLTTAPTYLSAVITMLAGDPVAAEIVKIGGRSYTARANIGACVASGEYVLSTTIATHCTNFAAVVNADPAQAGVLYFAGTPPNELFSAVASATTVTLTAKFPVTSSSFLAGANTGPFFSIAAATGTTLVSGNAPATEPSSLTLAVSPPTASVTSSTVGSLTAPLTLVLLGGLVAGEEADIITYHGELAGLNYSANA